jgi:hypothetical protein
MKIQGHFCIAKAPEKNPGANPTRVSILKFATPRVAWCVLKTPKNLLLKTL